MEWDRLRPWNGSQSTAFEELICQLACYEPVPSGSTFVRKGTPDAGVECFWALPGGSEYGWQAKFFTSPPTSSQWGQVDSSVGTALDKHPNLNRYTICMAVDRPDARVEGDKSFLDRWDEHVAKWKDWAATKNMRIDFRYWGTHEIAEKLSHDEHRGRYFFWFHKELLTPAWFQQRLGEAIAAVGPRYTPELNVRLPLSAVFEALSRSPDFLARFQQAYGDIGKAWSKGSFRELEKEAPTQVEDFLQKLAQVIGIAKCYDRPGINPINWGQMEHQATKVLTCAREIDRLIQDLAQKGRGSKADKTEEKRQEYIGEDRFSYARHGLRAIEEKLVDFKEFIKSDLARLANEPALLLVGSAGTGKTHLFSDAAWNHVKAGIPAVLLLGNEFRDEEPWGQILRMLNLSCARDEFLGALESAAQLSGRRAVIFIDALNEGIGRSIWETHLPTMLACLGRYPWIAVAVSVRSSYERLMIREDLVPDKIVRFEHHGFADQEYEAAKAYFAYYGIELPAVPILTPEFQNPLFLRCLCRGLTNRGLTRIPPGIQGISSLFDFFLDSVNEKLASPGLLDFDPKSNLVGQVTRRMAARLSQVAAYAIPRGEAQAICDTILLGRSFENSLFRHLLSEGIFAETIRYDRSGQHQEMITFSYERLADYLIMRELLNAYVDPANPAAAFATGRPLGKYFEDEMSCWRNRGLAEALAIQGPELFGREIYELIPTMTDRRPVCEAFIESLLWRDPKTVSERCLPYVHKYVMPDTDLNRRLLNAFLTIAPNPDHPFNADFLHRNLMKQGLAERDAWWSIFLYEEYGEKRSVDRLLDWAWSETSKTHISDESIRLVGKTLIWFLTTSHRFLRDRTTKALVSLFVDRINVLCQVIPDFIEVNDPYILERLFSVAYGCALRSNNANAKQLLAQLVYDSVFKDGKAPCHILLRDYARGVVEVALHERLPLKSVEPKKIRPPYKSKWPLEIPPKEEVEKYGEWDREMPDEQWAMHSIYDSVMSDGDFARYVLGSDFGSLHWSKRRLDEPRHPSRKEQLERFIESLTDRQKKAWDRYIRVKEGADLYNRLPADLREGTYGQEYSEEDMKAAIDKAECRFRNTLGKRKKDTFSDAVLPYLDAPQREKDEFALPVEMAQRWILKRVFDLGWTVEHFGKFDRYCNQYVNMGRSSDKPERIGKKYQWLAYHEFLAHMADNLEFRGNTWSDKAGVYVGPWQLALRDVDPSCLLKSTQRSRWTPNVTAWWAATSFNAWAEELDEIKWRKGIDLLPPISSLPIVNDPKGGRDWFVLECFYDWEEPTPPEKDRFDLRRRYIWYMLKSYLVKSDDEQRFCEWAKNQHFMGRWMPESHELTRVYLGEFFWAPAFAYHDDPYYSRYGWTRGHRQDLPCEVLVTTDAYMQERGTYDCSIDETISLYLPAKWIADKMDLSWRGVDGCYFNAAGDLVAQDPSTRTPGPQAFLMDKERLSAFLEREGYRLVWTLLGEKDIKGGRGRDENWPGRLELSGFMRMKDGRIEGEARAFWVTQGPEHTEIAQIRIP